MSSLSLMSMLLRGFMVFCWLVLTPGTAVVPEEASPARAIGTWFTESVDAEKGMVHQVLSHRLADGRFVSRFRGRRHDLPDRLLDYTVSGKWEILAHREIIHLEQFVIHEPDVSPQGGALDAKDEYEILELRAERIVTRSKEGVTYTARRVPLDFKLPDLPAPPPGKQAREPDKTKFDAYLR